MDARCHEQAVGSGGGQKPTAMLNEQRQEGGADKSRNSAYGWREKRIGTGRE